jgi:hypothetical protein
VRLDAASDDARAVLARAGEVAFDGAWFTIGGATEADVPTLVAELVRVGARIYAVEAVRATLEERFLQLLRPNDAPPRDRSA